MVYDLRYYVTERVKGFYILTEKKLNDEKFNSKFFRLLFSPTSCFCVPSKCPYSHGKEKFYIKRARDHSPNYLLLSMYVSVIFYQQAPDLSIKNIVAVSIEQCREHM